MKTIKPLVKILVHHLTDISMWKNLPKNAFFFSIHSYRAAKEFGSFFILLIIFIITQIFNGLRKLPLLGKIVNLLNKFWAGKPKSLIDKLVLHLDTSSASSVKRSYLIGLSYKNLMAKKTRTFVTVLGMSIGVGIIVLLLSLGYGVERLIINRIASLNELKILDISTGSNTALRLNKDSLEKIKNMKMINAVMPLVSFVGKVDYNNAKTDVLVYSTNDTYLKNANIKLLRGKYYVSGLSELPEGKKVAGTAIKVREGTFGNPAGKGMVQFTVHSDSKTYAWESCTNTSDIIGIVRPVEGGFTGREYWGDVYAGAGQQEGYDPTSKQRLQTWIRAEVPIFYETYDGQYLPKLGDNGRQIWQTVCMQKDETNLVDANVLGESTISEVLAEIETASEAATLAASPEASESASLFGDLVIATDEAGVEVVSFANSNTKKKQEIITFRKKTKHEALVSNAFLRLLNIPLSKAIGTSFNTSFVLTKSIIPTIEGKASTEEVVYKIIGVIDDQESPYFYIALDDAAALNITSYSQLKVVLASQNALPQVRKEIEGLGFRTSSTADTVSQIENLFGTLRILLALIGLVALGVASLGMFNTLTVSLLERTREIGGMKTIGMISKEVRDLFLAEAMILGMAGGFGGLLVGFIVGKIFSFLISLIAIANGEGYLELTYIPWFLIVVIVICSFLVGIVTGFYPAHRAKKISALNALRYE